MQPESASAPQIPYRELAKSAFGRAALAGRLPDNAATSLVRALSVVAFALEHALQPAHNLAALRPALTEARSALDQAVASRTHDVCALDAASLEAALLTRRLGHDGEAALLGHVLGFMSAPFRLHGGPHFEGDLHALAARAGYPLDTAGAALATAGAARLAEGLCAIVETLARPIRADGGLLGALNAEAGSHALPGDVRELCAALRAADASFARVAYYSARFGARGVRFSRSDSAWLAVLARDRPEQADKHVRWLGRVLANRGMPQWLMEEHLFVLHRELAAAVPEHAASYAVLLSLARAFGAEREAALSPVRAHQLRHALEPALAEAARAAGGSARVSPTEACTLLLAALADERAGAPQAVASLAQWLADPKRFGLRWAAALERTIAAARADVQA